MCIAKAHTPHTQRFWYAYMFTLCVCLRLRMHVFIWLSEIAAKHVSGKMKWHLLNRNSRAATPRSNSTVTTHTTSEQKQNRNFDSNRIESIIDSESILTITLWIFNEIKLEWRVVVAFMLFFPLLCHINMAIGSQSKTASTYMHRRKLPNTRKLCDDRKLCICAIK